MWLTDVRTMSGEEVEPGVSLTHLLRLCRDEHRVLWEHHADPRCRTRVKALVDQVGEALPEPGMMSTISGPARRALAAALEPDPRLPAVVVAHALAELLRSAQHPSELQSLTRTSYAVFRLQT